MVSDFHCAIFNMMNVPLFFIFFIFWIDFMVLLSNLICGKYLIDVVSSRELKE